MKISQEHPNNLINNFKNICDPSDIFNFFKTIFNDLFKKNNNSRTCLFILKINCKNSCINFTNINAIFML